MANMIDATVLFQALLKEKARQQDSLDFTFRMIGQSVIDGKEISAHDRGSVREYKGRIAQIEQCINELQRIKRESE